MKKLIIYSSFMFCLMTWLSPHTFAQADTSALLPYFDSQDINNIEDKEIEQARDRILQRLYAAGVSLRAIEHNAEENKIICHTETLVENDHAPTWLMQEQRLMDEHFDIKSLDDLLKTPLILDSKLSVYLASYFSDSKKLEMGINNKGVFLGFVAQRKHPVVIKVLRKKSTNISIEIAKAQFLSICGKGSRFYGAGKTKDGHIFYAFQPICGEIEYTQPILDIYKADKMQDSVTILCVQYLRTPSNILIPIDAGDIDITVSAAARENADLFRQELNKILISIKEKMESVSYRAA